MSTMFDYPFFYYDAPGGDGGGAPQGDDALARRLQEALDNLAKREGGDNAAGLVLLQENRQYRERIRNLEQELGDLKGKVPTEDALVLTKEDAALWNAYKEIGTPDELKTVKNDYTGLQRTNIYRDAAEAHALKAAVLGKLPGVDALTFELREVEQDGQKAKVAFVKNGDGQERPLMDHIKSEWSDFLPALQTQQQPPQQQQKRSIPFPPQNIGGGSGTDDKVADHIKRQKPQGDDAKKTLI